ncbi:hypothetical protein [Rhodoferax sp.]|uniref:hypothetical protein n=1 Tax=Rhodoferax sp. TaxID=50421 RepID=UPI0035265783
MPGGIVIGGRSFHLACDKQQNQAGNDADQSDARNIYFPKITCEIAHFYSNQVKGSILLKRQVGSFVKVSRIFTGISPANDPDESQKADHSDQ